MQNARRGCPQSVGWCGRAPMHPPVEIIDYFEKVSQPMCKATQLCSSSLVHVGIVCLRFLIALFAQAIPFFQKALEIREVPCKILHYSQSAV